MMTKDERPFFKDSTAKLEERVDSALNWYSTLHEVYVELAHRERPAAKALRQRLAAYFEDHESYFPWPTTDAAPGDGELPTDAFEHKRGVLGFMGYSVGRNGAARTKRCALLDDVYLDRLPFVNSAAYMAEWGKPQTSTRLKKMATSIAEFAKARKRSDPKRYAKAIRDWEDDLGYLRVTYYEGTYSVKGPKWFAWPKT
jgi:hypothetical protein